MVLLQCIKQFCEVAPQDNAKATSEPRTHCNAIHECDVWKSHCRQAVVKNVLFLEKVCSQAAAVLPSLGQ